LQRVREVKSGSSYFPQAATARANEQGQKRDQ
jgi:hypothetical protein